MKKVKCWVVFDCNKKECPAFKSSNLRCWLFSGTQCRDDIQGKFMNKIEMCLNCRVFKTNMDIPSMKKSCRIINKQIKEYTQIIQERDRELEKMSMELALGLSEVFEGLKKISTGDPSVKISEMSEIELISKLKHIVNLTAENIGEIVDQSHEFAMVLAEYFDVFHRVAQGDLNARVTGESEVELLEALKKVINETIESIDKEIKERKSIEESLRKMEDLESSILMTIPHAVVGLRERNIFFANDAVEKVFGWKPEELIGKNTRIFYRNKEDYKEIGRHFYPLLEKQKTHSEEFLCRHKDGRDFLCKINASVIGERLEDLGIVVVYEDISEKKAYERKLVHAAEEWRATFDSMPYGVMLLDADLNILRENHYISKLYNIPFQTMAEKRCCDINFGSSKPAEFCSALQSKIISGSESIEYHDANLNKYFMMHGTPILDEEGSTKAFVLSLIDITEIKDKEMKLIESKDAFFNMLKELDISYKEIKVLYESLIHSFVNAIDAKSPWTKGHSERVTNYSVAIAKEMGLMEQEIEMLRMAALLHDVGKIGTYDVILDKPGKLTDEEFALIRLHPVRGEEILKPIKQLRDLLPIIRHHHERVDGRGYPDGLTDGQIPFLSKIIAVADSYDSMTSDRPYRPAPSKDYAIAELRRCSGTQFDREAAEAFLRFLRKEE
jgi:PAS domain S-box-containing protein/putative nucleotidyltransferase with HDIG domain